MAPLTPNDLLGEPVVTEPGAPGSSGCRGPAFHGLNTATRQHGQSAAEL